MPLCLDHSLSPSLPLARDVPGSFCTFSAPALKAGLSSKSPSVFQWRVTIRSWDLGATCARSYGGVPLPRPSQWTELEHVCVLTVPLIGIEYCGIVSTFLPSHICNSFFQQRELWLSLSLKDYLIRSITPVANFTSPLPTLPLTDTLFTLFGL